MPRKMFVVWTGPEKLEGYITIRKDEARYANNEIDRDGAQHSIGVMLYNFRHIYVGKTVLEAVKLKKMKKYKVPTPIG